MRLADHAAVDGDDLARHVSGFGTREPRDGVGDVLDLTLDVRLQVLDDPSGSGLKALKMGPLVLARDSRLGDVNAPYVLPVTAERVESRPGMKAVYKLNDGTFVCDYASAGNEFSPENTLRVFC